MGAETVTPLAVEPTSLLKPKTLKQSFAWSVQSGSSYTDGRVAGKYLPPVFMNPTRNYIS